MSVHPVHALHDYEEKVGGPPGRVHPQSRVHPLQAGSIPRASYFLCHSAGHPEILISELFAVTKAWCPLEP